MSKNDFWDLSANYTRIKLCEFECLDSAYEASHIDADALGFHIFSRQNVSEKVHRFAEIFGYMPDHIHKVLLTDVDYMTLVEGVLPKLAIDAVQLYPDWTPERIGELRASLSDSVRIIKVMSAQTKENIWQDDATFVRRYAPVVDGFLLDSWRMGGTGVTADWSHCADIVRLSPRPVILAGGLRSDNVAKAIRTVRPFGVDVETGVSDRLPNGPLVKNMLKCREFVDVVRTFDRDRKIPEVNTIGSGVKAHSIHRS